MARMLLLSVGVAASALSLASAASLSFAPGGVAAGFVGVDPCTTAGLSVLPNLSGPNIVSVTVGGLPAACGTATLRLTVNNGLTSSGGTATVPAGGGSVTVTLAVATVTATRVQTDLVLVGP